MNILRKIEEDLLTTNDNIDKGIKPMCVVSIVYKTMSKEARTMQNATVLEINRIKIKAAIIDKNNKTHTVIRTFFLHSPSLKSIKIRKMPSKRHVKAKYNYLVNR